MNKTSDVISSPSMQDQALRLGIKSITEIRDEFSIDLLNYLEQLEPDSAWETVKEGDNFKIKQKETSKFSDKVPINSVQVELKLNIPLDILIQVFQEPSIRMNWDKNVKELKILEGEEFEKSVTYTIIEEDFYYKGDFVERKILATNKGRFIIILYSIQHDLQQIVNTHTRGINFFSIYSFSYLNNSIQLQVVSQVDQDSIVAKMNLDQSPNKLLNWAYKYENAALSVMESR